MIIKDNRLAEKEDYQIKPLDFIRINLDFEADGVPDMYMVVQGPVGDQVQMVSMMDGYEYDHEMFNHPIHLHNHLFKHYGKYELIKSKHVQMELTGPVRLLQKERKFR